MDKSQDQAVTAEPVLAQSLQHFWFPVATAEEIAERPLAAKLLSQPLVLWRSNGRVSAFYDLCIHRGTPLSMGSVAKGQLICAYHGWHYGGDGACTWIPSLPRGGSIPGKARATAYRTEERYGLVWICLSEPWADIPTFPEEFGDPAYRWGRYSWVADMKANAARVIENLMDFSHFAWVHPGILGDRDDPVCPPVTLEPAENGFQFEVDVPLNFMNLDGPRERQRYTLILPFTIFLQRYNPGGPERQTMCYACSPVSLKETKVFRFIGNKFEVSPNNERISKSQIFEQDRPIVEAQRPEELPLDLREELHLRGPDAAALEYRKLLAKLGVTWG